MSKTIADAFAGGKAFIPFITCGDPSLEVTEQLVYAMEEAAAAEAPMAAAGSEGASSNAQSAGGITEGTPAAADLAEKIIYSAYAEVETTEFDESVDTVYALMDRFGAFMETSSVTGNNLTDSYYGYGSSRTADFTLRVPKDRYSAMTSALSEVGNVTYLTSNADNITAQYTDTASRLSAYEVEEARLLDLMLILHAEHGRHARGRGEHGLERRALGVLDHQVDALETHDVADLVRVVKDAGGAVGDDAAGVFAGREHRGFDVDVAVEHARGDIGAACLDHLCVLADAVLGVADEGDAAAVDGNVDMLADLVRADVDEPGVEDDRLGGHIAHRDGGEGGGAFPKRHFADLFAHSFRPFRH